MNDSILVIKDTAMIHKESHSLIVMVQKQSHDITQTVTQISSALSSTAITGTILSPEVSKRL